MCACGSECVCGGVSIFTNFQIFLAFCSQHPDLAAAIAMSLQEQPGQNFNSSSNNNNSSSNSSISNNNNKAQSIPSQTFSHSPANSSSATNSQSSTSSAPGVRAPPSFPSGTAAVGDGYTLGGSGSGSGSGSGNGSGHSSGASAAAAVSATAATAASGNADAASVGQHPDKDELRKKRLARFDSSK